MEGSNRRIGVGIIGLSAKGGWAANAHVRALEELTFMRKDQIAK